MIASFFGANLLFAHIYANKYAQIDDDKVEQHEVLTEALGLSFAVFMVRRRANWSNKTFLDYMDANPHVCLSAELNDKRVSLDGRLRSVASEYCRYISIVKCTLLSPSDCLNTILVSLCIFFHETPFSQLVLELLVV